MAAALLGMGEAAAQTADFKCAEPGTAVEYSNLRKTAWAWPEDDHCRLFIQGSGMLDGYLAWYAPTIELSGHQLETFPVQVKPRALWPLAVNKTIAARYFGPSQRSSRTLVTIDLSYRVERYERLDTSAGRFDAFLVVARQKAIGGSSEIVLREWYAPSPGVIVKYDYRQADGGGEVAEATSISRR